jgi:Kef-type K+ transport system membrane component KefB
VKVILGAALVIIIALLGSRRTFTRINLPLLSHVYLTGTEYIVIGILLGDHMIGLLDQASIAGLSPVLHLVLGWIGLMFGAQLEIRQISRFPKQYFLLALLQATFTMLVCFVPFLLLMSFAGTASPELTILGALTISAIAIPTAQSSLVLIRKDLGLRGNKLLELLSYVAGLDALVGLVFFGIIFCFARTHTVLGAPYLVTLSYVGASLGLGIAMGSILHLLTWLRCSQEELLLYTLGTVLLFSGIASYLGISPLFVTLVGGFVTANVHGAKVRILRALTMLEKPFYITMLILGGAMLDPPNSGWTAFFGLTAAYVALRIVGKSVGGFVASRVLKNPIQMPGTVGLGLISQGGIAVAMIVSFHEAFATDMADTILMIVLTAIVVNELVGPFLARRVLKKAC